MGKKLLIVIDMQQDFTYGALKNQAAIDIIPAVLQKTEQFEGEVIFTKDTHTANYLSTQEGRRLPVPHCIQGTPGWDLVAPLEQFCRKHSCKVYCKPSFGSTGLAHALAAAHCAEPYEQIQLVGICTDICVISNALLLKAALPEVPIAVDAACCAGVTPESHHTALEAMRACQIDIL